MKAFLPKSHLTIGILSAALTVTPSLHAQTTAVWGGLGGDGSWNTAANWDIGVPADGTNAFIGSGNVVSYSSPMVATSFLGLTNIGSTININAAGFVVAGSGNQAVFSGSSTATKLFVNSGGVL